MLPGAVITTTSSGALESWPSFFTVDDPTIAVLSTNVTMRSLRLAPTTLAFSQEQNIRPGLTVNVTTTSENVSVGVLDSPLVFDTANVNPSRATGVFTPLTAGTTDLTLIQPAGFETPSNQAQVITATVDAPNITINGTGTIGVDLQVSMSISLQTAPPAPTDVTVSVGAGGIATISEDPSVAGGTSVTFEGVTSTFAGNFVVQGRGLGSTLIRRFAAV